MCSEDTDRLCPDDRILGHDRRGEGQGRVAHGGFPAPALPFVAMRFTLAGLLLLNIVLLLGLNRPGRKEMLSMAGVGVLGVGMNNVAFTVGVSMTTASDTAL